MKQSIVQEPVMSKPSPVPAQVNQTDTEPNQQQTQQNQQSVQTDSNEQQQTQNQSKPSIIDKVNQAAPIKTDQDQSTDQNSFFDYKQIEQIADPAAREAAMAAYKSMQGDYTRKTQELANARKDFENERQQASTWTPDRIGQLIQDNDFVSSLQTYYNSQSQSQTDDETYMTDEEKQLRNEIQQNKIQMQNLMSQQSQMLRQQQDAQLSQKYADYDANKVNQLFNDMMSGKYTATNEDIWKVTNYENAINKAYELGRAEERQGITEKSQYLNPVTGMQVTANTEIGNKLEGESNKGFINRILQKNMQQKLQQQQVKTN